VAVDVVHASILCLFQHVYDIFCLILIFKTDIRLWKVGSARELVIFL